MVATGSDCPAIALRVERRVEVNEVNAAVGQFAQLVEIVAAVDDAGVDEGGGLGGTDGQNTGKGEGDGREFVRLRGTLGREKASRPVAGRPRLVAGRSLLVGNASRPEEI